MSGKHEITVQIKDCIGRLPTTAPLHVLEVKGLIEISKYVLYLAFSAANCFGLLFSFGSTPLHTSIGRVETSIRRNEGLLERKDPS
jgi:hypothetical protein